VTILIEKPLYRVACVLARSGRDSQLFSEPYIPVNTLRNCSSKMYVKHLVEQRFGLIIA
jgi:hypothetical protein